MENNTTVHTCQLCPLFQNNPENCTPIIGRGYGTNLVIAEKPTYYSVLSDFPEGIEYDFIRKIFAEIKKEFFYTHMIKCMGKYGVTNVNTCKKWLTEEMDLMKPKMIFTLGAASKIFTKEKINKIVGKTIEYNKQMVTHLYSPNYILKKNKSICEDYRQLIIKHAT